MSTHAIARVPARVAPRGVGGQSAVGLLVAALAAGLTVLVSSRSTVSGAAVLIVVGGAVWFATTRRTQLALALLMVYLGALDGYLKLGTGSNLATFGRDVLLYAIVIGLLVRAVVQGKRLRVPPLGAWVIGFVVLVLVQFANPQDGSLYHSLAAVRQDLEFVPLFFLAFAFVRTTKALRIFVILLVLLAAANGVADYVQFHMTPQQLASWGPGYAQRILGGGEFHYSGRAFYSSTGAYLTRPFGLMSDEGSGGLVCALALGGILALGSIPGRRRYLILAAIAGAAAVAGVVTSQGRAVIVSSVVVVLAYALLTFTSRRAVATLLGLVAVAAITFVTVSVIESSHSAVFRYKGVTTSQIISTTANARGLSISRIPKNLIDHPLGGGLGVGGPSQGVSGAPALAGVADAETEFSFATLEAGIPGMLVIVGLVLVLFALGLKRCRREPDPEARVLLAAIVAPTAGMFALYWAGPVTPTTPCGPYLWAAAGIVSYWLIVRPKALRQPPVPGPNTIPARNGIRAPFDPPRLPAPADASVAPAP